MSRFPGLLAGAPLAIAFGACSPQSAVSDDGTDDATSGTTSGTTDTDGDPAGTGDTGDTGDTEDTEDTGDDTSGGTGGDSTGSSTGGPEEEQKEIHAEGFVVSQITANQGVAVPIYENGAWVENDGVVKLPQRREVRIQALWELSPDWEPREIVGQLTIFLPDGSEPQVARNQLLVQGESSPDNLEQNFSWFVPVELTLAGTEFQAEFFEAKMVPESTPDPENPPIAPAEPKPIGFEDSYQVLRAVLVPVKHEQPGRDDCFDTPEVTEEYAAVFREYLHLQNPVERTEIRIREPFVYSGNMNSYNGLLSALADLHGSDPDADPSEYYYGLVRPCGSIGTGTAGQAISIPNAPTRDNAHTRTSMGLFRLSPENGAKTFVHEIGHTQGRRHVECSGQEGGPDPAYPHEGGSIGVWGFGIHQPEPVSSLPFSIHSPVSGRDYMTYCANKWVSDWGWEQVYPFIEEISSWDMGDVKKPDTTLLFGNIEGDGTEHWITVPGGLDETTEGQSITLEIDGQVVTVPAYVEDRPPACGKHLGGRSDSINVLAEVPPSIVRATSITRVDGRAAFPVDVSKVALNARTLQGIRTQ